MKINHRFLNQPSNFALSFWNLIFSGYQIQNYNVVNFQQHGFPKNCLFIDCQLNRKIFRRFSHRLSDLHGNLFNPSIYIYSLQLLRLASMIATKKIRIHSEKGKLLKQIWGFMLFQIQSFDVVCIRFLFWKN